MSEEAERIVYEESVRTLDQQRQLLDGLRNRSGTLLAAASVATAFLSAQALLEHQTIELVRGQPLAQQELDAIAWSAIVLFCAVVLLTVAVLIPWRWTFAHHPHALIGVHLEWENPPRDWRPSTLREMYRDLSYWNGVHYEENGRKLQLMFGLFAAAAVALAAEIVLWLILLAK